MKFICALAILSFSMTAVASASSRAIDLTTGASTAAAPTDLIDLTSGRSSKLVGLKITTCNDHRTFKFEENGRFSELSNVKGNGNSCEGRYRLSKTWGRSSAHDGNIFLFITHIRCTGPVSRWDETPLAKHLEWDQESFVLEMDERFSLADRVFEPIIETGEDGIARHILDEADDINVQALSYHLEDGPRFGQTELLTVFR